MKASEVAKLHCNITQEDFDLMLEHLRLAQCATLKYSWEDIPSARSISQQIDKAIDALEPVYNQLQYSRRA